MPKSNSNDIDTPEEKRNSPSDHANILPHQPSIKQEERESDVAGSPQVHLPNPLNSMYTVSTVNLIKSHKIRDTRRGKFFFMILVGMFRDMKEYDDSKLQ